MGDYILNKLNEMENRCNNFYPNAKCFFTTMKRDYIILFFLAILWDKYFDKCSSDERRDVVQKVFGKKPALGDFVTAAEICASHCENKSEKKALIDFLEETRQIIIFNRNQEGHKNLLDDSQKEELINNWVRDIGKRNFYFFPIKDEKMDYEYSFLIPHKRVNERNVKCACIDEKGNENAIWHRVDDFKEMQTIGSEEELLYYSVRDKEENETVYRLSPFIHYHGTKIEPIFTLYSSCVARTCHLKTEARSLFDNQIADSSAKNILAYATCSHVFQMNNFFKKSDSGDLGGSELFYHSDFCNVKINKSSYAEFQLAASNSYKYTEAIVKEECKKVYDFCKSPYKQLFVIAGAGGLGKTALLLNLVQKIMGGTLSGASYDKVIFLSAKKSYLIFSEDKKKLQLLESDCDIRDFSELKHKLAWYISEEKPQLEEKVDEYIIEVLDSQKQSILLMVDDLDSLSQKDQDEILNFISNNISPEKMKTIITTRNINRVGMNGVTLDSLDEKKCVEFVRWFVDNYVPDMKVQFDSYLHDEKYKKSLVRISRGIPIFIEKWVDMNKFGKGYIEIGEQKVFTQRDCIRYLYNTTVSSLDTKSMQLIFIMNKMSKISGLKEFEMDFLFFISSVEMEDELEYSLKNLIDTRLIHSKGNGRYALFDFEYDYIPLDDFGYYETPVYQTLFLKFKNNISTGQINHNNIEIILQSLEENKILDESAGILLDKLCSRMGKKYCNANQAERSKKLQEEKDYIAEDGQSVAFLLGDWNPDRFDSSMLQNVLERINSIDGKEDARYKVFEMAVNACIKQMETLLVNYEGTIDDYQEMIGLWKVIREVSIGKNAEYVKELKKKFKEIFDEAFEDVL
uniref:NACHT domain-containing protein n=1 Tax=Agathobacter sp. TaxID=2021311 RepID=UPI004056BCFB